MAANTPSLSGKRVAILATDGVEQVELTEPRKALDAAGANTKVVSPKSGSIKGWNHTDWGDTIPVDAPLDSASPNDFDALLLPGGVINPDHMRTNESAVNFVRAFFEAGKPVAAICHGPWMLVEADVVRGRRVTSWPSLKTDLRNAGANWADEQVVTDHGLVTSRKPDDIPAFNRKMIEEFAEGVHEEQRASVHAGAAH
jgi:protease I